jgi:hypothetical protein
MSRPWLGALGIFALAFILYALSLSPGVFSWDSAELTLGIYTQGIVHATGYPLYLISGRLFTLLPLSADFAIRANLFSAFCGALTLALLYSINLRLFKNVWIATASALLYGLARAIWAQAVVAEVYTLHTALIAGIVLLVIEKNELRTRYVVPLLFGLALANHMAAILVALVHIPYLLWKIPAWRTRFIFVAIMGLTAGILYLYLPLRFAAQPDFNLVAHYFDRDLRQPADLFWMVSGRMFGREMFAYPLLDWLGEIGKFFGELSLNFLGVGVLLGAAGIYNLWRTNRQMCLLLGGIFTAQVLFFSSYDVFDKWTMFHTAYLIWAIFVAAGCVWLLKFVPALPLYGFLTLLFAVQLATNWNTAGRSGDTFVAERAQNLLAALPQQASLIGPWTAIRPSEYRQIVYAERPDVNLIDVTLLALGERDRLGADASADLQTAVDERLQNLIACAPADVFVVDPAVLNPDQYQMTFIETGLYRITSHPDTDCGAL